MRSVVIIDYQLGNLYSVHHACKHIGLDVRISSNPKDLEAASALILPGVGAFAMAMENMAKLGLAQAVIECVEKEKPLFGVCLGLQMLFSGSDEFSQTEGLGIIPGSVVRLSPPENQAKRIKVPHIGWNRIHSLDSECSLWSGTPLEPCSQGEFQYFVHSFVGKPDENEHILSNTNYCGEEFCSAVQKDSHVTASQFHPEKSGQIGLEIYRKWAQIHKLI